MRLIREKGTNIVTLAFSDAAEIVLTDTNLTAGEELVATDITTATHEVLGADAPVLPMRFVAGALTYAGEWVICNSDLYERGLPAAIARDEEELRKTKEAHNENIICEIKLLEETVTARRIREAVFGTDNGWLAGVETQIAALRAQLQPL